LTKELVLHAGEFLHPILEALADGLRSVTVAVPCASCCSPPQHACGGFGTLPVANTTHAAALDATMPQLTAAFASWRKSREEIRRQRVAVVFMVISFSKAAEAM